MNSPEKERVGSEQVLRDVSGPGGRVGGMRRLPPIQRAGFWLALGIGSMIGAVVVVILTDYMRHFPDPAPLLNAEGSASETESAIANFKAVQELVLERITEVFDLVVVKALLPVFMATVGYLFGIRRSNGERTPDA